MKTFKLFEDQLIKVWRRTYYEIEAETLEEAIESIRELDADSDECETLYETEEYLGPGDNDNCPTHEIYNRDTTELIWDNTMK